MLASDKVPPRGRAVETPVRLGDDPVVVRSLPLRVSERRGWVTTGSRSRPAEPVPRYVRLRRSSDGSNRERALAGTVLARPDGAGGTARLGARAVSRRSTRDSPAANGRPVLPSRVLAALRGRTLAEGPPLTPNSHGAPQPPGKDR